MKKVLVISRGIFHPSVCCRKQLRSTLMEIKSIEFEFVSDFIKLDGIDTDMYQAVILFFHEKLISKVMLDSLISYADSGGVLFFIHGALASFKNSKEYTSLTGGIFTGHDEIKDIHISGDKEFIIRDELYKFLISGDCNILLKSGSTPVLWTRKQGKGTVIGLSPGHKVSTFKNNSFKEVIKSAIVNELKSNEERQ